MGLQAPHLVVNKAGTMTTSIGKTYATNAAKVIMEGFADMQVRVCV